MKDEPLNEMLMIDSTEKNSGRPGQAMANGTYREPNKHQQTTKSDDPLLKQKLDETKLKRKEKLQTIQRQNDHKRQSNQ